ncbi:MAG TPA: hypothetical protein DCS33_04200 [Gammaproteobacteria bacterium]|nr:hypothetical protein [Gammaproteobacteria bacterium]
MTMFCQHLKSAEIQADSAYLKSKLISISRHYKKRALAALQGMQKPRNHYGHCARAHKKFDK